MGNYPQELAQDAVCQSHTGHRTGLWFPPTRPLRLNTNEWMNEWNIRILKISYLVGHCSVSTGKYRHFEDCAIFMRVSRTIWPWIWKHCDFSKRRLLFTSHHCVTFVKTRISTKLLWEPHISYHIRTVLV